MDKDLGSKIHALTCSSCAFLVNLRVSHVLAATKS